MPTILQQPTFHCSSDTAYPESGWTPKIKGSAPTSMSKPVQVQAPSTSKQQVIKCGFHNSLLRFQILLEWHTELRKAIHLLGQRWVTKGCAQGQQEGPLPGLLGSAGLCALGEGWEEGRGGERVLGFFLALPISPASSIPTIKGKDWFSNNFMYNFTLGMSLTRGR